MQQHRFLGPNIIFAENLPDDGTLIPKHVAVGTWYEVCFVICFIVFWLVHFVWFFNREYKKI